MAGFAQSNNGNVTGNHGASDFWVVKLLPDSRLATEDIIKSENRVSFYPNPAKDKITFTEIATNATIFTIIGTKVLEAQNTNELNVSNLSEGNYLLKITTEKGTYYKKLLKE